MRELKQITKKERQKILEEDTFLEDVLYPMVDAEKAKQYARKKRGKLTALIAAPLTAVGIIAIIVISILLQPDTTYIGFTETIPSDVATLNQSLINTQFIGEFDLLTVTYDTETRINHFFTLSKEIVTEEVLITYRMNVVIDRDYPYAVPLIEYEDSFLFLDYTVEFLQQTKEIMYEDMPVNEFTIEAYFDTGQEIFYISYSEISLNENSSLKQSLKKIIIKKGDR